MTPRPVAWIRHLEEIAANAWPARVVQHVDGWRLRFGPDRTWRTRSIWPNRAHGPLDLEERLAIAREFYARRGEPVRFQTTPAVAPEDLDAQLARRGFARVKPTCVQTADTEAVAARTGAAGARIVEARDAPSEAWLATYAVANGFDAEMLAIRRALFDRIGPPRRHVLVWDAGEPVSVGLGVAERGFVGVFSMATLPAARRRGAATTVLGALAAWALAGGARSLYLQVEAENEPARALYTRLGFETRYEYAYRVAP